MDYFKIVDSFEQKARWYLRAPRTSVEEVPIWKSELEPWKQELEGWRFTSGIKFEVKEPLVLTIHKGTEALDFTLGAMDMPIVSNRVAECMVRLCGDAVQWIPATVQGRKGMFNIVNVVRLVDAIDRNHSEINFKTERNNWVGEIGAIAAVSKLVLNKKLLKDENIFRLTGWEPPILISRLMKSVLENAKITGVKFQSVDAV